MLLLGITLSTSADDFAPPTPTIANGVQVWPQAQALGLPALGSHQEAGGG